MAARADIYLIFYSKIGFFRTFLHPRTLKSNLNVSSQADTDLWTHDRTCVVVK